MLIEPVFLIDFSFEMTYSKGANNRVTTKLVIRRVRPEDYGSYICSGTNSKGDGDFTITLEGKGYMEIHCLDFTGQGA